MPARLAGNSRFVDHRLARPRRSTRQSARESSSAAAVRTTGPSVVASFERIAEHVLAREVDEAVDECVVQALVHVDALQAATGLAAVEVRAVDDVLDRVREIRVVAHVDRIAAAELEPGADEALRAARCTAWPPATEPVNATKSTRGSRIARSVSAWLMCSAWNTPSGRPASLQRTREALGAQRRLRRVLQNARRCRP